MSKFWVLLFLTCSMTIQAQEITTCQNPKGYAFYHHTPNGIVQKNDAGWLKDEITNGTTTLRKLADGKYDILIMDARKSILSLRQDGGEIILLRHSPDDATFLHIYPGNVIELYTFWKDGEGKYRFDILQSKGGKNLPIHKSSVMTGLCSSVKFDLIK